MNRTRTTYRGTEIIGVETFDVNWVQIRRARDYELSKSDWRAGKDVTLSAAWREYRQALRDIPQDHEDANTACDNWPEAPE
tara:strand:+ start:1293 stop:1535 length:243 start_codon:yes stop_codon:yes gene_type:complete